MKDLSKIDEQWMGKALVEASKASTLGEVPIGAISVEGERLIAMSHNLRESVDDPLGHAELILLRETAKIKKSWRLEGVTIYVTCEPCIMCAGAILQARIKRLVYGCPDPKAGGVHSLYNLLTDDRLNHRVEVEGGVLGDNCAKLLKDFFKTLRNNNYSGGASFQNPLSRATKSPRSG